MRRDATEAARHLVRGCLPGKTPLSQPLFRACAHTKKTMMQRACPAMCASRSDVYAGPHYHSHWLPSALMPQLFSCVDGAGLGLDSRPLISW